MKKLLAAALALTVLTPVAAFADGHDWRGGGDGYYYRDHDNNGAAIVAGAGIAALALYAATRADRDRYEARGYYYAPNGYYYRNNDDYWRWQRWHDRDEWRRHEWREHHRWGDDDDRGW